MKKKILVSILISLLIFSLASCSSLKRISGGGSKNQGQSLGDGPPPALLNLEKDLDKLVGKVEGQVLKTPEEQQPQGQQGQAGQSQSGQSQSGQQSKGGSQSSSGHQTKGGSQSDGQIKGDSQSGGGTGGQQSNGQAGSKSQQATQQNPNDISKMLPDLEKDMQDIHKTWNGVQPELLKKGADKATIDKASEALNTATTTLDSKDGLAFLKAINEFYKYMPDIEEKLKPQTPPGLMRLTYYARDILYSTFSDESKTTVDDIAKIEDEWKAVKPQLKKGSENEINKVETSIDELKNSLDEENKNLIKIKSKILLDDIKALDEKQKK